MHSGVWCEAIRYTIPLILLFDSSITTSVKFYLEYITTAVTTKRLPRKILEEQLSRKSLTITGRSPPKLVKDKMPSPTACTLDQRKRGGDHLGY